MKTQTKTTKLMVPVFTGLIAVALLVSPNILAQDNKSSQPTVRPQAAGLISVSTAISSQGKAASVLKLDIRLVQSTKGAIAPAKPVVIDVTLKNMTSETMKFVERAPHLDFLVEVKNSRGRVMPLTRYGLQRIANAGFGFGTFLLELKGGQQKKYTLVVNRIADMTCDGVYWVKIKRGGTQGKRLVKAISNTLKVSIAE